MCGRDGISFNLFCTSAYLRQLLRANGFKGIPTLPNKIKNRVVVHCGKIMGIVKSEFEKTSASTRFTLTHDKYTPPRNRRYMGVNVHCGTNTWGWESFDITAPCPQRNVLRSATKSSAHSSSTCIGILCACEQMEAQSGTVGVSVHRMAKKCRLYQCGGKESVLVCG